MKIRFYYEKREMWKFSTMRGSEEISLMCRKQKPDLQPAKMNSSPYSDAGVVAQYALHIWISQEESRPNWSRKQRLNTCTRCPQRTWEWNVLPESSSVKFCNSEESGPRGNDPRLSTKSKSLTQRDRSPQKPHQVYKYDLVHPHFHDYTSHQLSSGLSWPLKHALADICIRRRK